MKLAQMTVADFITELGRGTPTPGGGSVAALCGALGAGLSGMVANLTAGRERFKEAWPSMEEIKGEVQNMADRFLELAQEDADAYRGVIAALKRPKQTEQQRAERHTALQNAMKRASTVPLDTLRASEALMRMSKKALERGNPIALTDAAAAVQLAQAAAMIAAYNVRINLASIEDFVFVSGCKGEVSETLDRVAAVFKDADEYLNEKLQ